jgi:16S rRNA (guanine(966)-N(2))-methyltransferase RsmD
MRVIAGKAKGHRLFSVPGKSTRPITDRVKEALFDILAGSVVEARFLDLFAGTGAVGIEALSRGAREATFVERNPRALATLRRNLQHTRLHEGALVVRRDVFTFVASYQGQPFDIAYVAPPQFKQLWAQTLQALDHSLLLAPDSLVIAQIHPKEFEPLELTRLSLSDQRRYGSTMLCFYELGTEEASLPKEPHSST